MSMTRWWPVMRAFAHPRSVRPFTTPFRHWDDVTRVSHDLHFIQREMDRVFNTLYRVNPYFGPGFEIDAENIDATVTEKDGKKHLQIHFDVRSFKPAEIEIKTKDGKTMEVHAKHEENSESGGTIKREYHRIFAIPENVRADELSSVLNPDGILSISAPIHEPIEETKNEEKRTENINMSIKHE